MTNMKFPLSYKFNETNVKNFLDACDDKTRPIAKIIIDNTRHVSFEELIRNLNKNIKDLNDVIDKNRPIFVFVSFSYVEKSNYWIYLYLKEYIDYKFPERRIILLNSFTLNNKELKNNDTIVFIDDFIYSGSQMASNISNLINVNNLTLNIYILASFISKEGKRLIENIIKTKKHTFNIIYNKHIEYIPKSNDYLTDEQLYLIQEYYTYRDKTNFNLKIIFENFFNKYLIYFDHKLADAISTIPLFYSGIVPNIFNRNLFNINYMSIPTTLEIIPLFKNCENVRNIDRMRPKCPSTPYKMIDNDLFMKQMNKRKKAFSY